ncbi:MAG: DUF1573 domain-containing protein [Candidatus Cyclobacteriaceae bacterium M3_2C_046]
MKIKILFVFIFFLFFNLHSEAQPKIYFQQDNFDFGEIAEGNNVRHDFEFINQGDQPLIINQVRASCGCTTPFWSKEPILSGQKGIISAAYNSKNRPGAFRKSIKVISNGGSVNLYIKGVVKQTTNRPQQFTAEEISRSPVLALENKSINLGKIELGQKVPVKLKVNNEGIEPLQIKAIKSECNCTSWNYTGQYIKQNDSFEILIEYAPETKGLIRDEVVIYSNDRLKPQIKFHVEAKVVESLSTESLIKQNKVVKF